MKRACNTTNLSMAVINKMLGSHIPPLMGVILDFIACKQHWAPIHDNDRQLWVALEHV